MTPGAPSPGGYNPHTPGSNIEQGNSDWVTTDILVRVKDSFMDLMGQIGVIRSVTVTHGHVTLAGVNFSIRPEPQNRLEIGPFLKLPEGGSTETVPLLRVGCAPCSCKSRRRW